MREEQAKKEEEMLLLDKQYQDSQLGCAGTTAAAKDGSVRWQG